VSDSDTMISFAITVKNEGEYVANLLDQLVPYCEETGDEIVVLDDNSTDEYTLHTLNSHHAAGNILLYTHDLNNDFATHKNFLNDKCVGGYIFQVDADETLHPNLLKYLHDVVDYNNDIDLFLIPRVNVVNGITEIDMTKWGWWTNDMGWICFPDYQTRIYRNSPSIQWSGKVHERIVGHKTQTSLPAEEEWALYHIKEIERQRSQNNFYNTIRK
jgi:glycosyltransferase involved in cell wall biosynthesis